MMKILKKGKPSHSKRVDLLKTELKEDSKFVKFSLNLPRSLHKDFRTKCSMDDKDMKDVLIAAIEEYLSK